MKRIFLIAILILIPAVLNADEKKEKVKYQVDITIRYNALSADDAAKMIRSILIDHKDACEVNTKATKADNNGLITISTINPQWQIVEN